MARTLGADPGRSLERASSALTDDEMEALSRLCGRLARAAERTAGTLLGGGARGRRAPRR